ncbi:MAG TPA: S8 family serine peptidase, partial [Tessaracoccus flavescens]|nr:S8 family serine peptidase [Tessaracoccus flavescens]
MTQPRSHKLIRAVGAGLLASALCAGTASTASASPLPEPIANGPSKSAPAVPSVDEMVAQLGDYAVANRWLVEVDGTPKIQGGNSAAVKRAQNSVVSAAAKQGIKVQVNKSYDNTWNGFSMTASQAEAAKLSALSGVKGVFPVIEVTRPAKDTARPDIDYARTMTGADVANEELGFTGKGIKVGIIDSGIDYNHPDFGGSGTNNEKADFPSERVAYGYDYVGDAYDASSDDPAINTPKRDQWPDDCGGHGTHVAGIVGASGGVTGVAPDVTFGAYR